MYNIREIIGEYEKKRTTNISNFQYPNAQSNGLAAESIKNAIVDHRIALIQGPPGTGKTTTFMHAIENTIEKLDTNEVLLYIAPTNALVNDMFRRVCAYYAKNDMNLEKDIPDQVRVYGSQFDFTGYDRLNSPLSQGVRIVISTNYQRIFTRERDLQYHLLIDEASKSPLHQPFQTLVNEMLNENTHTNGKDVEDKFWEYTNAGYVPYNAYECARFGLDCHDQYKALGVSYGFLNSEFKVSYIFSGQYDWFYYNDLGGSSNMPYIGYLNFTTNMRITGSSYATNGQTYGASVWMIICPDPTYETSV